MLEEKKGAQTKRKTGKIYPPQLPLFSYSKNMANFEAFLWNFLSSRNLLICKELVLYTRVVPPNKKLPTIPMLFFGGTIMIRTKTIVVPFFWCTFSIRKVSWHFLWQSIVWVCVVSPPNWKSHFYFFAILDPLGFWNK